MPRSFAAKSAAQDDKRCGVYKSPAPPKKTCAEEPRAVCPGALSAFLRKNQRNKLDSSKLLHHDLAIGVERALHAHALSIELSHVGLVIDVVHLA